MCRDILDSCGIAYSRQSAADITTFKGGGHAIVALPKDEAEFVELIERLEGSGAQYRLLGGGSNTIIADGEARTLLISTRELGKIEFDGDCVRALAGARLADIRREAHMRGLGAFEFLSGVPATVGGALYSNAGAFGEDVSKYVEQVQILQYRCDFCGAAHVQKTAMSARNAFEYRRGISEPILSATFRLRRISADESEAQARRYMAYRRERQPRQPSCGSVFVNGKTPSGKLIEQCGLKGVRLGGAQISEVHANFIVNAGGATATDFLGLVELCEREVYERFGVALTREFVLIN